MLLLTLILLPPYSFDFLSRKAHHLYTLEKFLLSTYTNELLSGYRPNQRYEDGFHGDMRAEM
jgi:hypothetical protein